MEQNNHVGMVVVSHNYKLAEEIINFVQVLKLEEFPIENGGTSEDIFGTRVEKIIEAIEKANLGNGVLIFADMGSSILNSLKAKEQLKNKIEVEIADAPMIEGMISAVAANFDGTTLKELKQIAEDSKNFKKIR